MKLTRKERIIESMIASILGAILFAWIVGMWASTRKNNG